MKPNKGLSLLLAIAMVAGLFPARLVSLAAEVTSATLMFASGQSASIVSGGAIDVTITKPDYYVEDTEATLDSGVSVKKSGLNIKIGNSSGDLEKIEVGGNEETSKILNIGEDFFPNPDQVAYTADLDISGAYKALLTKGSVVETGLVYYYKTDGSGNPVLGPDGNPIVLSKKSVASSSFTIDPQISVFTTSVMRLICKESETEDGGLPAFEIQHMQGDAFVGFERAIATRRARDSDPLVVTLFDGNNQECKVTLSPETIQSMNENGVEFTGGKKRWVQKGSEFELSMPQAKSNNVLLKVYSPKAAADQIRLDLLAQNGEAGKQNFIELADGDTLEFIRQNFRVAYDTTYFNTQFYLTWSWVPDDPQYANTVRFPTSAPAGFQPVQLDREYDDVKGKLKVEITCRRRDNPVLTTVERSVTIKGTGKVATLEAESRQTASDTLDPITNRYEVKTVRFEGAERQMRDFTIDAYDGRLAGVKQPEDPSAFTVRLNMGLDNAASLYAVVECSSGGKDLVSMKTSTQQGSSTITGDYAFGGQISNPYAEVIGGNEGVVDLTFLPNKIGTRDGKSTTVTVTFYVKDGKGKPTPALVQPQPFRITVKDSSPNSDATLSKLQLLGQVPSIFGHTSSEIDFGFSPSVFDYQLELENKFDQVILEPTLSDIYYADKTIKIKALTGDGYAEGWEPPVGDSGSPDGFFHSVRSGSRTPAIPLIENQTVRIQLLITAEDTSTQLYNISILRKPKSNDATLKSLSLSDPEGKELFNGIQPNVFEYFIEIPFKVQKAKVAYETNDSMATASFTPELKKETIFSEKVWLDILEGCAGSEGTRSMDFVVDLTAEEPTSTAKYIFHITRSEPSNVNTLRELGALDASEGKDSALTLTPPFRAGMETGEGDAFEVNIPYSTNKVKISAKATDTGATVILLAKGLAGGGLFGETESGGDGWMILGQNSSSKAFVPAPYTDGQAETTYYVALVEVWPESMIPLTGTARPQKAGDVVGGITYQDYMQKVMRYPVHIYREPASREGSLKSIELADQDANAIDFREFDPETTSYTISVPYEVAKVSVKPTALYDKVAKIEVNGKKVANGAASSLIALGETTTDITIVVYPEDTTAENRTYLLHINRLTPSNDALLIKLEAANAEEFKPVFAPSRISYTAKVAQGSEGVKITATANHAAAKIEINGQWVESGKPSELIRILEVNQTVKIVVTAQDGKTTKTYTIKFRNDNLVDKSSNADLEDLEITPGAMRPTTFKPSVTEYEVAVDDDTYDVELFPEPADSLATMKVFLDSKEIGDDDDNYAAYIQDGENEFTIEVTSPDESKTKTYTVYVYRDEEDRMGNLTPLDSEEIDFENSPDVIIVDITRYSRINSNVFQDLRDYPDKKIIFQGNDYSLQFDASDIDRVIPNTEVYDFGMSFDSPVEDDIYDEIDAHNGNSRVHPVLVSFTYHGDLPGPALLTLSLGKKYKNETLYWHYYNEERERIDYYGNVKTNSKGTFSLILDHMSTYLVAEQRIVGSEDKDTGMMGTSAGRDLTAEAIEKKLIPNTGAGEERR